MYQMLSAFAFWHFYASYLKKKHFEVAESTCALELEV